MANSSQNAVKQTFMDVLEHYAVRKSVNCLNFDELSEQTGGLYSNHVFVEKKYSDKIYEICRKEWQKILNHPDVVNYHSKEVNHKNYRYIVNLCRTPGMDGQRERTHLDAVFNTNVVAKGIGYTRVFSFPCKYFKIPNILKYHKGSQNVCSFSLRGNKQHTPPKKLFLFRSETKSSFS